MTPNINKNHAKTGMKKNREKENRKAKGLRKETS